MLLIRDAHDLLEAFRPRDLRIFELPDEGAFPLLVRDYRAWVETGGARVYLVYEDPDTGRPRGVVFRRSHAVNPVGQLCDWCHSPGGEEGVGLLTAEENAKRRLGVLVCRDLGCRDRLEDASDLAGRNPAAARRRLLDRIVRFAREGLGIAGGAASG